MRLLSAPATFSLKRLSWALGLSFLAHAAGAQSLVDMVEAARTYDASFLAAQASATAAQYRADQAGALRLPTVGLQAGASRSEADTPYSSTRSTNTNATNVTLQAQQSLFNRANSVSIEQAQRAVEISQAQLRAAEQDLMVRVAQAYFDVLGARDTLSTVQAAKKANSEQLASAKRNFEVGTATITDTREAQARYDLATAQELAADNDLRVKSLALEQLVGKANLSPKPLAQPVVLPGLQPAEVGNWVSDAMARNASIEQARLALAVAKLETEKARAGHLPTVALAGSYGKTHVNVNGDVLAQNNVVPYSTSGTGTNASVGVTVNVPLFAGYAIQNRVKETLALEDKARNDHEAAQRGVTQGTRSAFFGVQSGLAQVKALEAAESSSKLALDATQLGYKVGVRVNLDVLNAQTQLYQTQRDLAKARYEVLMGGLKLRQVAGNLSAGDVQAVNALLAR